MVLNIQIYKNIQILSHRSLIGMVSEICYKIYFTVVPIIWMGGVVLPMQKSEGVLSGGLLSEGVSS